MSAPVKLRLPKVVVWLGVVSLLNDVATEMIYPLLPVFLSDVLRAPGTFVGAVEGAAEATASLLKVVAGRLTDRLARRKPLALWGYGLSSLARPFIALATHPWHVLATRVGDRVGKGLRASPRDALIADASPADQRGRAYGFHQAMDNVGAVLGPLLAAALLAAHVPLRYVLLSTVIPGALALLTLWRRVAEEPRTVAPPTTAATTRPTERGPLLKYLVAVALFGLGNSSDAFLLLRARQLGVHVALIPLLWMVHNAVKAALSTGGGSLSDRVGRRGVILSGWLLYAGVYLAFGWATAAWQMWALFALYAVYYAVVEGTEKALVADLAPAASRGLVFGWYNAVVGVVSLPSSLLFGAVFDRWGARVAFGGAALLALAAGAWLLLFVGMPRRA